MTCVDKPGGLTRRTFLIRLLQALGLVSLSPAVVQAFTVISEAQEVALGQQADQEVLKRFGRYEDPALEAYVAGVGERLLKGVETRGFQYQFKVLDSQEVNAMALPGGYVYVTRGMLAELNSEAELAGVLGHEIAHVTQRHAAKQLTRALGYQILTLGLMALSPGGREYAGQWGMVMSQLFQLALLGYGREAELEADEIGLRYTYRAGYDPRVMGGFLRRLRLKERLEGLAYHGFSTHPETGERVVKAETLAGLLADQGGRLIVGSDSYKAHLEGLVYGDKKGWKRIRIYTARGGESLAQVAREVYKDEKKAWNLAFFNGLKEGIILKEGEKLKVMPD